MPIHEVRFLKYIFVYLLLSVLSIHCCADLSLVAVSGGYSPVVLHGLLIAVASRVVEHGTEGRWASVVVAPGL